MSSAEYNVDATPEERLMSQSEVLGLSGADPEVKEIIQGLLSDDPKGFLAKREADELVEIRLETRARQAKYYNELRQRRLGGRVASVLRRHRDAHAE